MYGYCNAGNGHFSHSSNPLFYTAELDIKVSSTTAPPSNQVGGPSSPSSSSSSPPLPGGPLGSQDSNPHVIPRRHAPVEALARQGSFRGFPALSQKTSPFKRQLSLRMNELPSTMQRKSDFPMKNTGECLQTNPPCPPPQRELFHWFISALIFHTIVLYPQS